MKNKNFTLRTMTRKDVDIAVEWAAREGWNPGLMDADCYYLADSNGFLMGFLGDQPIATISVIKYAASFGFLGFYIVKPEYRGQGYGMQIWKAGLHYLAGRNIGLDGVVAQQQNYMKSGFRLAHRNIRFAGSAGGRQPDTAGIVELAELPFAAIDSYSRPFFPTSRSPFTRSWINQPGAHALGILHQDKLCGYGVIRPCREGYKIGPLFADSRDLAEQLLRALTSRVAASAQVYLDVPEVNHAAVELAEQQGMSVVFETARMYTQAMPDMPFAKLFGITSFEIG